MKIKKEGRSSEVARQSFDFPIAIADRIETAAAIDLFCPLLRLGRRPLAALFGLGQRALGGRGENFFPCLDGGLAWRFVVHIRFSCRAA